jgi:phosphatidylglycerophosphate synthase
MDISFKIQPLFMSKITTTLQIAAVFFALFFKALPHPVIDDVWLLLLYWLTAGFTILTGYQYVVRGVKLINPT